MYLKWKREWFTHVLKEDALKKKLKMKHDKEVLFFTKFSEWLKYICAKLNYYINTVGFRGRMLETKNELILTKIKKKFFFFFSSCCFLFLLPPMPIIYETAQVPLQDHHLWNGTGTTPWSPFSKRHKYPTWRPPSSKRLRYPAIYETAQVAPRESRTYHHLLNGTCTPPRGPS